MTGPEHLGINAVFLRPRMGGMETYVKELVPRLMALRPGLRVSIFVSPEGEPVLAGQPWAPDVELVRHPLLGLRGLKAAGELTLLGALASRRRVDVLHSVAMTGPLRLAAAHVVTLADVTWLVAPDPGDRATVRVWRTVVPPVARRATRAIAISEAGARDVVAHLGVPRERVDVTPLGHGTGEPVAPTPEGPLRARLGLGDGPIALSFSAKRVHKNLGRLIGAMRRVREQVPGAVLVLPGNPTPHEAQLREQVRELGLDGAVAFPPYVDDADREGLYAAARCFVFPSVNEGFGLPVLEAMRRGVPVTCADASALPEVAGDAALLFDPYDEAAIADATVRVMTEAPLRERLIAAGAGRQALFTWERTAELTLESYDRAWRERAA